MITKVSCSRAAIIGLLMIVVGFGAACNRPADRENDKISKSMKADLLINNAKIWTANEAQPWAEAIAVSGEHIVAVGSDKDLKKFKGADTKVVDAGGALLLPGFIDSHLHFLDGGFSISGVQLKDAPSKEVFIRRIADYAKTLHPGEWILDGNWDHENWGGELPTRDWIDEVTPDNPVFVQRSDGHMALANSLAIKMAGLTDAVKDVDGGTIVRDEKGHLTGMFKDNAIPLISSRIPDRSADQYQRALEAAMQYVATHGVTSVHHMGTLKDVEVFKKRLDSANLITRIYATCPLWDWPQILQTKEKLAGDEKWLKLGGAKLFADGSLGSHTAAFTEPYTDMPSDTGLLMDEVANMQRGVLEADKAGLQVVIHAIGDRANHIVLNMFEKALAEQGPRDRRFRIEHAQHLLEEDIQRFASLGVIASMQPWHCIDDGRWAEKVIGPERLATTHAWRSLLDSGARLAFGSDWFVAPPVPLEGIFAALTRQTLDGKHPEGWVPEQRITLEEALRAYTIDAAYASFDEKVKGSLEVGKLADFVILSENIFEIPAEKIWDVKVVATWVGGRCVHNR